MGSSTLELTRIDVEEPLFLPAGWEVKHAASDQAVSKQLIESDETTGRVVAITGITGVVDHVNDLIEVGAYTKTLAKRRPKVCWAHDWEKPIGKVLAIEEWLPGDPRFAEVGATLNGKAWPAEAGALVASMQFNMKSERGREAFLAVEFYSESDECEWSIGWQPIPAKTLRRKSDGVRVCKEVELFEVSPVLFGAAPHTRTLSVKSLRLDEAYRGAFEIKVGQAAGTPGAEDDVQHTDTTDENALHTAAMDSIDWAEVDAAIHATPTKPAKKVAVEGVVLDAKALTGGLADLDFTGLATLVKAGEGGADRNRGGAEELRRWYEEGEGAAKIRWGQPGDFGRCTAIAGKHMTPERAKGYCNLRHKGATGVYAGQEKTLGVLAAEGLSKTWNPLLEIGADAAHTEAKWYPENIDGLAGSFEQRSDKLRDALNSHLREHVGWKPRTERAEGELATPDDCWVSIDGTWDDRVIATVVMWGPERSRRTFEVPYSWDGSDVRLGEPSEVEIRAIVVPAAAGDVTVEGDDLFAMPALDGLDDATIAVKGALGHLVEGKAGRVLSDANGNRLRGAIEHLLAVAVAAGIDVPGWTNKPQTDAATDTTPTDTTAPVVDTPGTPSAVAVKTLRQEDLLPDFLR